MKLKDTRKILLCAIALLLLIVAGGYGARRGYVHIRQARLINKARAYLDKKDDAKAGLCLRAALGYNPKDVEAARLMADLTDRKGFPEALAWRKRVVELAPSSIRDRLALANTALRHQDLTTSSNALAGLSQGDRNTADYHNLAGLVALSAHNYGSAEEHFREAFRLQPTKHVLELNLAVLRLKVTNTTANAEARLVLKRLSSDAIVGAQALRELAADAWRNGQTNEAVMLSSELVQNPNSTFTDKIGQLSMLWVTKAPEAKYKLEALRREAVSGPEPDRVNFNVQQLGTWQKETLGPTDTLRWLQSLDPQIQTNAPAAILSAECRLALKDWAGLQHSLTNKWGEREPLRHALLARALRGQELTSTAKTEWEQAVAGARSKNDVLMLLQLATDWNWYSEKEQQLWTFVNHFPAEQWAPLALAQLLYDTDRIEGLSTLYTQLSKANLPTTPFVKNTLAMLASRLNAQQFKPYDLANELHRDAPTNAVYAMTYSLSLYRQNKSAEALQILEQLPSLSGWGWVHQRFTQLLYQDGWTQGLLAMFSRRCEANTNDLSGKNDLAMVALLLDAQQLKPYDLAYEVYKKIPTNSIFASTYAFSLYRQNKAAEALNVLGKLPPEDLETPGIALYYGLVLKSAGQAPKAQKYLELATKATLLPEEKKLLAQARGI